MSAPASWERWVTAPRQDRARATFERVLDAGAQLLAEQAYDGFSMAEVCRRAKVAPGTLYDRVDTKESLFLAIHDRELERITAQGVERLSRLGRKVPAETGELVDKVVTQLGRHFADDQPLLRVFILRAAVDVRVRNEGAAHVGALEEAVVTLLMTRRDEYPHTDPQDAVRTTTRIVLDSLSWRTAFGSDFRVPTRSDAAWTARLRDVARTYLLTGKQ